jgi:hypothetical protein
MKRNIVIGAVVAAVIVVAALVVIFVPFGGPGNQEARKKADTLFVDLRNQGGTATFKAVHADGDTLVIKGLTLTPPAKATRGKKRTINVDEVRIRDLDWKNTKQPQFADITFKGARVPALKSDPKFQEFAKVTGLTNLVFGGHLKYRLDKDKQRVVVDPLQVTIDQMGEYTFNVTLEGINTDALKSATKNGKVQPAQMMGLMGSIRLGSLTLTIKDMGGTERLLKFAAAQQKKSVDEVRKETLAKIDAAGAMAKGKLAAEALTAAKKFLTHPGTLTISAKPPAPVALFPVVMGVMTAGNKPEVLDQLKTQLGLTITAE